VDPAVPMRRTPLEGVSGDCFAVEAPPAMIVIAAMSGAFGETPVAVVSGINAGLNLGRAILHSGTVGAALTAQNLGHPAVAISQQTGGDPAVAAAVATEVLDELMRRSPAVMANVNVPSGASHETEVVTTRLARYGSVTAAIVGDELDFQLVIDPAHFDEEGTDGAVVRSGRSSVTVLDGFGAAADDPSSFTLRRVRVTH
jgi:5'-nucleotidase